MNKLLILALIFHAGTFSLAQKKTSLELWYNQPASDWMTQALPIGNGYMGAMIFGGTDTERIQFNEETLWEGGPGAHPDYQFGIRNNAWKNLSEIRRLLNEGKQTEAEALSSQSLTGIINPLEGNEFGDFGAFQNFGDIFIDVQNSGTITNYKRSLDLTTATAHVSYQSGNIIHQRSYFASYPRRMMVFNFTNTSLQGITYQLKVNIPHQNIVKHLSNNQLSITGNVRHNKLEFEALLKIESDGQLMYDGNNINITNTRRLTLYLTAATTYKNSFPTYRGNDYLAQNRRTFAAIENRSYNDLMKEHVADYQNLFNRVAFQLDGSPSGENKPTNERLINHAVTHNDRALEVLYFQHARYLAISSSRPGCLPMTLQGKWNHSNRPPWASDYHTNINLQMLYWPVEATNLSECALPLADYTKSLDEPGKLAAKEHFGARGWTVNTMNNAFGYTAPGWGFPWGFFPGGGAWLCRHLWEHYLYTNDRRFLQFNAFPLMRESVCFWLDYLTPDEKGYLVSMPSYSPEHGGISKGATMDHQIVWDLFNNYLEACKIVGDSSELHHEVNQALKKLYPLKEGRWGQLQEWKEDIDDPDNKHRHVSHLYGLYPGYQISVQTTPELARAAQKSLEARGDGGTGWSLAWKINFWARLGDGNRAHQMLTNLLNPVGITKETQSGGTYPNIFCAHPPFQLDGNMGGAAGITEMLLQSQNNNIHLLPALPVKWETGEIKGLKARGNITVDLKWRKGELIQTRLFSPVDTEAKLLYKGKTTMVKLVGNKPIHLKGSILKLP
jgi:alpha-L-fucosidase 2